MDYEKYDWIMVGAGFYCSVLAERLANVLGKKVLVIDKRTHTGGNCHSEKEEETGIEYHKYGTHIFHTSNEKVWSYLSQFTKFNSYYHQVLTTYKGKVYQMPINLETINSFFGKDLKPYEVDSFMQELRKEIYEDPSNFEEQAVAIVGRELYEAFIEGYTIKQWGRNPKDLPASIIKRLPFRKNYNESYFFDTYQGMPTDGYAAIFDRMLDSPNIDVRLGVDFRDIKEMLPKKCRICYSGPIDELMENRWGMLEYRTLSFEMETIPHDDYQGTSVMNYAEESVPYTRIHEPKHMHPERENDSGKTLIIREYSSESKGEDQYYPIGGDKNLELYQRYVEAASEEYPNIIIGGRLGDYRYYDMHHVIEKALEKFEEIRKD